MISLLQRKSLQIFHPLLKRVAKFYLSKPRLYKYDDIKVRVIPGVFHPGLFYSTKVLLEYLDLQNIGEKSILELGAGSGLISIFCAKKGGLITSSDINNAALDELRINAEKNNVSIRTQESNLFDKLDVADFDLIIINPPYYPRNPDNIEDHAWFCGEDFEYFKKLFLQLKGFDSDKIEIIMILSEDCDFKRIESIGKSNFLSLGIIHKKTIGGEENYIYRIVNDLAD